MIFCLSIDLDPIWCYQRIYGFEHEDRKDMVTEAATRRFCELTRSLGIPGTLFVVGETLKDKGAARALRQARDAGHEIGNHTHSHPYDLSRQSEGQVENEIARGAGDIQKITGVKPVGFRAPGYTLGRKVLQAAVEAGVKYDSSMLPSPAYQGVKAAAMGLMKMRGKASGAIFADPRESLGPNRPYRPDPHRPWKRGNADLLELPITSVLGIPLTGSVLSMAGPSRAGWLAHLASRKGYVCLELHGVDLMDIRTDGLDPKLSVQPDLAMPWQRKQATIEAFVEHLLRTHKAMTLEKAAATLGE